MTCGIYEIKNKQDDTVYIGQSINIESRWRAHLNMNPLNTNNNLRPTLELANDNPELVDFNIIKRFSEEIYNKEEMKFVLSIHEKHELELRGGPSSDKTINVMPIHIPEVNPSLFLRRSIPEFVNKEDVLNSVLEWARKQEYKKRYEPDYEKMYCDLFDENLGLSAKISELEEKNSPKEKMSRDYELFRLKQRISKLKDEKDELEERVDFWKRRCTYWREVNGY